MFGKKKAGRATGTSDRAEPKKDTAVSPRGAEDPKEEETVELAEKLRNLFSAIDGLQRALGTAPSPDGADEDGLDYSPEDDPEDIFEDDLEEDFDLDERVPAREKRVSAPKKKRKARPARSAKPKKKEADYSWIEEEEEMMWDDE